MQQARVRAQNSKQKGSLEGESEALLQVGPGMYIEVYKTRDGYKYVRHEVKLQRVREPSREVVTPNGQNITVDNIMKRRWAQRQEINYATQVFTKTETVKMPLEDAVLQGYVTTHYTGELKPYNPSLGERLERLWKETPFGYFEELVNRRLQEERDPFFRLALGAVGVLNVVGGAKSALVFGYNLLRGRVRISKQDLFNALKDPATWGSLIASAGVYSNLGYMGRAAFGKPQYKLGLTREVAQVEHPSTGSLGNVMSMKVYLKEILPWKEERASGVGFDVLVSKNPMARVYQIKQQIIDDLFGTVTSGYKLAGRQVSKEVAMLTGRVRNNLYAFVGNYVERAPWKVIFERFRGIGGTKPTKMFAYSLDLIDFEKSGLFVVKSVAKTKEDVAKLSALTATATAGAGMGKAVASLVVPISKTDIMTNLLGKGDAIFAPMPFIRGGVEVPLGPELVAPFASFELGGSRGRNTNNNTNVEVTVTTSTSSPSRKSSGPSRSSYGNVEVDTQAFTVKPDTVFGSTQSSDTKISLDVPQLTVPTTTTSQLQDVLQETDTKTKTRQGTKDRTIEKFIPDITTEVWTGEDQGKITITTPIWKEIKEERRKQQVVVPKINVKVPFKVGEPEFKPPKLFDFGGMEFFEERPKPKKKKRKRKKKGKSLLLGEIDLFEADVLDWRGIPDVKISAPKFRALFGAGELWMAEPLSLLSPKKGRKRKRRRGRRRR
ncbi:hypothetical protein [Pyrococcus kukulkanii]|uniref:hypothetical protein n=1 Tax=Pyrococcus kukulkanii TaxID=1609559 RepID=UPI00356693CF